MTIEIFCDRFISIKKYGDNELANDDIGWLLCQWFFWENAKRELSEEVQWVTQSDLYKKIKRNHDSNDEIILSKPVSIILEMVKSDFPHANVWVYQ